MEKIHCVHFLVDVLEVSYSHPRLVRTFEPKVEHRKKGVSFCL